MQYYTIQTGMASVFGGAVDRGMGSAEGVALYPPGTPDEYGLFSPGDGRLGHDLMADSMYCAMRWDYSRMTMADLRRTLVWVYCPRTGRHCKVRPVDWGPATWTGRVIDLSPGAMAALGGETDDDVVVIHDLVVRGGTING